jgi:hypothetical protein
VFFAVVELLVRLAVIGFVIYFIFFLTKNQLIMEYFNLVDIIIIVVFAIIGILNAISFWMNYREAKGGIVPGQKDMPKPYPPGENLEYGLGDNYKKHYYFPSRKKVKFVPTDLKCFEKAKDKCVNEIRQTIKEEMKKVNKNTGQTEAQADDLENYREVTTNEEASRGLKVYVKVE